MDRDYQSISGELGKTAWFPRRLESTWYKRAQADAAVVLTRQRFPISMVHASLMSSYLHGANAGSPEPMIFYISKNNYIKVCIGGKLFELMIIIN